MADLFHDPPQEGIPRGLKPWSAAGFSAKAEAFAYLEANAFWRSKVLLKGNGRLQIFTIGEDDEQV